MKKTLNLFAVFVIVLICSCNKAPAYKYGWWTFQSTTYANAFCNFDSSYYYLNATNQTVNNQYSAAILQIYFNRNMPIISGTYGVTDTGNPTPPANKVSISYSPSPDLPISYQSLGGANQKIQITVSNGFINASGSDIKLVNQSNSADTQLITFNITQNQK